MAARAEITTKYTKAYKKATKKIKGAVLDEVVAVTGWSRDSARRRLTQAANWLPGLAGKLPHDRGNLEPGSTPSMR